MKASCPSYRACRPGAALRTGRRSCPQQRNRHRSRTAASAQADFFPELIAWATRRGGWAHPFLSVSSQTASGSRGVVATSRIGASPRGSHGGWNTPHKHAGTDYGAGAGVVLRLPVNVYLTSGDATEFLLAKVGLSREKDVESLSALRRLALMIAAERRMGARSAWGPYIASLPADLPNGWALSPSSLSAELRRYAALPGGSADWGEKASAAAASINATAEGLARAFGKPLGGIGAADVRWGLGTVLSRCFGEEPLMALGPVIDLLNHDAAPSCEVVERDAGAGGGDGEGDVSAVEVRLAVPELQAGQELTIQYVGSGAPLTSFLNFGFVPQQQ